MKLSLSREGEFIPSWNGNLELPEDQQIKVYFKRITGEMEGSFYKFNTDGETFRWDNPTIVRKCVKSIENLFSVEGEPITTPIRLLRETGTHGLVTEIGLYIIGDSTLSKEVEKKNKNSVALDKRETKSDVP